MTLVIAPLPAENVEAWKAWNMQLTHDKKDEFEDFNQRHQIEHHAVWYTQTPSGPMAAVLHEGPGAERLMSDLATSTDKFDVWFRESIAKFHNIDFTKPSEGPMPEQLLDTHSTLTIN